MMYDLLVIGGEQEGVERALSAARAGFRVAIAGLESRPATASQLQEAANRLIGLSPLTMDAFRTEATRITHRQEWSDRAKLSRAGVEMISGSVRFMSEETIEVVDGDASHLVSARKIVIACGVRSRRPASFHVDEERVLTVESLLNLAEIPRTAVIVGAGASGLAAALLMARLGVEVTVVDEHTNLLEIYGAIDGSCDDVATLPIAFRLGDEVIGTVPGSDREVSARLAIGRTLTAEVIIVCVGGEGMTDGLDLEQAGVGVDEHGRLWCDIHGRTWSQAIIAVGDVISPRSRLTQTSQTRTLSSRAK